MGDLDPEVLVCRMSSGGGRGELEGERDQQDMDPIELNETRPEELKYIGKLDMIDIRNSNGEMFIRHSLVARELRENSVKKDDLLLRFYRSSAF